MRAPKLVRSGYVLQLPILYGEEDLNSDVNFPLFMLFTFSSPSFRYVSLWKGKGFLYHVGVKVSRKLKRKFPCVMHIFEEKHLLGITFSGFFLRWERSELRFVSK